MPRGNDPVATSTLALKNSFNEAAGNAPRKRETLLREPLDGNLGLQ